MAARGGAVCGERACSTWPPAEGHRPSDHCRPQHRAWLARATLGIGSVRLFMGGRASVPVSQLERARLRTRTSYGRYRMRSVEGCH
jgi:hypothetical protein